MEGFCRNKDSNFVFILNIKTFPTFFSVCVLLEESVEVPVAKDDDGVVDVEDELVDGHDLQEEDGIVALRSHTGLVDQELGPVPSILVVSLDDHADEVEEDNALADQDDVEGCLSCVSGHKLRLQTFLHIDQPSKMLNRRRTNFLTLT